jgi:hypothetical protein
MHTEIIDKITTVEGTVLKEIYHGSNAIVQGFGQVVAALLKGDPFFGIGIHFFSVGTGEATWDFLSTDERQALSLFNLVQLYHEIARAAPEIVYIDNANLVVNPGPTNRIEIRATFGPSVVGPIREFGLFGGDATTVLDSGIMITHKAHAVININETPGQQELLIRTYRITV